jgi:hypothetical protein
MVNIRVEWCRNNDGGIWRCNLDRLSAWELEVKHPFTGGHLSPTNILGAAIRLCVQDASSSPAASLFAILAILAAGNLVALIGSWFIRVVGRLLRGHALEGAENADDDHERKATGADAGAGATSPKTRARLKESRLRERRRLQKHRKWEERQRRRQAAKATAVAARPNNGSGDTPTAATSPTRFNGSTVSPVFDPLVPIFVPSFVAGADSVGSNEGSDEASSLEDCPSLEEFPERETTPFDRLQELFPRAIDRVPMPDRAAGEISADKSVTDWTGSDWSQKGAADFVDGKTAAGADNDICDDDDPWSMYTKEDDMRLFGLD